MELLPDIPIPAPKFRLKWDITLGILFIHLGALFAPMTFSWSAFGVFIFFQLLTGCLGITLAFHRLLTHRSFKVPKWLEYTLTLFGSLAIQGGPLKWVATHRVHHAYADRPQDPHSPNRGFWWAHVFWLLAFDDVLDHPTKFTMYVNDLTIDPVHRFIEKTHVLQSVALGVLLFALGGWSWVVWGIFARCTFVWHCTWLVNSAAHIWGYQTYTTNEGSRNNWWVAILTYGEGWHNNHHAYPTSAAHGLKWWEFDLTYAIIKAMALLGWATEIRLPRGNPAQLPALSPAEYAKWARQKTRLPAPPLAGVAA